MELSLGSPFSGAALEKLKDFLRSCGLGYDKGIEYSICLMEDDEIVATGSLDGSVLKCVAVSTERKSEGFAATIVSNLVSEAARRRRFHLFMFTKPENEELFGGLGFYPVAKTREILLMENRKRGVWQFVASLKSSFDAAEFSDGSLGGVTGGMYGKMPTETGAIVVNCNPFTLGHLYLIETASRQCAILYIFVVSENKSRFSAETRLELVRLGTAHLSNLRLCPTGPYLVSSATFPDYFLKDEPGAVSPEALNTELDIVIFAECFAKPLGISRRYVGTEPLDKVTAIYNEQMKSLLPSYGIEVIEIPRLENSGTVVSASQVRRLLDEGNLEAIMELVPPATYEYLSHFQNLLITPGPPPDPRMEQESLP